MSATMHDDIEDLVVVVVAAAAAVATMEVVVVVAAAVAVAVEANKRASVCSGGAELRR